MDIVCIGEALIDFTPYHEEYTYVRNFGGAPANVAITSARLGAKTSFIGKIGNDQFGKFIYQTLVNENVDITGIIWTDEACTTLTFVHLDEEGERSFEFIRKPGADLLLGPDEINYKLVQNSKILHFGSAQLCPDIGFAAITKAVITARKAGVLISFDPNYRERQWNNPDEARTQILKLLKLVNLLKVSQDEAEWLTSQSNLANASSILQNFGIDLVVISCGAKGAFYRIKNYEGMVKGYQCDVVDTTGAGDAFWGTILTLLSTDHSTTITDYKPHEIENIIKYGNAAGSLCVRTKGAITYKISKNQLDQIVIAEQQ